MLIQKIILKDQPKEQIFKTLVGDFFKSNPAQQDAIISIKENKETRSSKQNRLYWEWVTVFTEIGYTKEQIHLILRDRFLDKIEVTTKQGKKITEPKSTTSLSITEFKDYLEQIDMLAAEYGIILPHPEDLYTAAIYGS